MSYYFYGEQDLTQRVLDEQGYVVIRCVHGSPHAIGDKIAGHGSLAFSPYGHLAVIGPSSLEEYVAQAQKYSPEDLPLADEPEAFYYRTKAE